MNDRSWRNRARQLFKRVLVMYAERERWPCPECGNRAPKANHCPLCEAEMLMQKAAARLETERGGP